MDISNTCIHSLVATSELLLVVQLYFYMLINVSLSYWLWKWWINFQISITSYRKWCPKAKFGKRTRRSLYMLTNGNANELRDVAFLTAGKSLFSTHKIWYCVCTTRHRYVTQNEMIALLILFNDLFRDQDYICIHIVNMFLRDVSCDPRWFAGCCDPTASWAASCGLMKKTSKVACCVQYQAWIKKDK